MLLQHIPQSRPRPDFLPDDADVTLTAIRPPPECPDGPTQPYPDMPDDGCYRMEYQTAVGHSMGFDDTVVPYTGGNDTAVAPIMETGLETTVI